MLTFESLIPSAPKQRFSGIDRTYTPQEVHRLRGSLHIQHILGGAGANRLWALRHDEPFVAALVAVAGNQAMPIPLELWARAVPAHQPQPLRS